MLATYMRRMRNKNLEIRIAGTSFRPQTRLICTVTSRSSFSSHLETQLVIYNTGALKIHICNVFIAPCKLTAPESGKFLKVASGMGDIFACAIRKHGFWNPAFRSRNPESWNPSYTDKESCTQCLESGIHGVESTIQDFLGLPYMGWCLVLTFTFLL